MIRAINNMLWQKYIFCFNKQTTCCIRFDYLSRKMPDFIYTLTKIADFDMCICVLSFQKD